MLLQFGSSVVIVVSSEALQYWTTILWQEHNWKYLIDLEFMYVEYEIHKKQNFNLNVYNIIVIHGFDWPPVVPVDWLHQTVFET